MRIIHGKVFKVGALVRATTDFWGRITPPPPVWAPYAPSPHISEGCVGIYRGRALGAPELHDVEFEDPPNRTVRVEVSSDQIELAR